MSLMLHRRALLRRRAAVADLPVYLFGKISKSANQSVGSGTSFEPTFPQIDYAGTDGMTTAQANRLTVQETGDYLGVFHGNYTCTSASESHARLHDGTTIMEGALAARVGDNAIAYGRQHNSFVPGRFAAGNHLQAYQYLSGGSPSLNSRSALTLLRPGAQIVSVSNSAGVSVADGAILPFDEVVTGDASQADLANNRITVPETGWYFLTGGFRISTTGVVKIGATFSGSVSGSILEGVERIGNGFGGTYAAGIIYLQAGETLSATIRISATRTSEAGSHHMSLWKLRDADILGLWGLGADYTIPNATSGHQTITYDNLLHGSGALVGTSGKFAIQETGWYLAFLSMGNDRLATGTSYLGPNVYNETAGEVVPNDFGNDIEPPVGEIIGRASVGAFHATAGDVISTRAYTINGQPQYRAKADFRCRFGLVKLTAA